MVCARIILQVPHQLSTLSPGFNISSPLAVLVLSDHIEQIMLHLGRFTGMPKAGLEPARLAAPPPQDGVSANSTTSARCVSDLRGRKARGYVYFFSGVVGVGAGAGACCCCCCCCG